MTPRFTQLLLAASLIPSGLMADQVLYGAHGVAVPQPCGIHTATPADVSATGAPLSHSQIRLASWNMMKSSQDGWQDDLEAIAGDADIVLLQEATLEQPPSQALEASYGAFAPGYSTSELTTGVMTISAVPAMQQCAFQHQEPWLGTPKATSITLFPLDNGEELLVINLHGVNFTLSPGALAAQLSDSVALLSEHRGPAVLAGDFNTWSGARNAQLEQIKQDFALNSVPFAEDKRKKVLGYALDHILVRGLEVISSETFESSSSDHNGLTVTLSVSSHQDALTASPGLQPLKQNAI